MYHKSVTCSPGRTSLLIFRRTAFQEDLLTGEYFVESEEEYYHESEDDELYSSKDNNVYTSSQSTDEDESEDEERDRKDPRSVRNVKIKDENTPVCFYFLRGTCRYSDEKCRFRHEKDGIQGNSSSSSSNNKHGEGKSGATNYRTVVCKFFLENRCEKGDDCTFLHEIKDGSSISRKKEEHNTQKDLKKSERAGSKGGGKRYPEKSNIGDYNKENKDGANKSTLVTGKELESEMATLKKRMIFLEKSLERSKEKT